MLKHKSVTWLKVNRHVCVCVCMEGGGRRVVKLRSCKLVWNSPVQHEPPLLRTQHLKPVCSFTEFSGPLVPAVSLMRSQILACGGSFSAQRPMGTFSDPPGSFVLRHSSYHYKQSPLVPNQPWRVTGNFSLRISMFFCSLNENLHCVWRRAPFFGCWFCSLISVFSTCADEPIRVTFSSQLGN